MCSAEHGFTLVELLVALFIFSLIAAAGVALLSFSVRVQTVTTERLDRMGALQRANALLTADLLQTVPRPVRDREGATVAAFVGNGGGNGAVALGFVRSGWSNPDGAPRPGLQRVEYRHVGDRIERVRWQMLDGADAHPPSTVIEGVRSFAVRYHAKGVWRDRWDSRSLLAMPDAVEIVADIDGAGKLRQLFLTGTGGRG
jgi:general secretion pathway protein J